MNDETIFNLFKSKIIQWNYTISLVNTENNYTTCQQVTEVSSELDEMFTPLLPFLSSNFKCKSSVYRICHSSTTSNKNQYE